ncbi:bifunctional acetate--CoA ligase family protein/GNAT family N-acetyltransferase [Vibrio sp. SM6]|uniref:Bifunctional acetate--CoA ligase family protein/GNAT family N-acetyltransferase n=1 Tax=Vibrio agarilyticus TaxID=2726741 RepID=A0A7X8TRF6_9VIBR|nr:bifunctional acetate--CoA ligase family protein/GNAT family N-acetyltransferase [Vibrio agarilyticus]NLS13384.1 bifunctional acetate--CoA ligase family protein/GNAT family N-acetyltransferase [Vibrio agarilyticus]
MSRLHSLFKPEAIAIIGASQRHYSAGHIVIQNLLQGGFEGAIMPVTPKYTTVCGVLAYPTIAQLPLVPDIAILCTAQHRNPSLISQLAQLGVKFVIIVATHQIGLSDECVKIAKTNDMRILGPNSLGLILPWQRFNASLSPINALQGNIAFISQSAAVCTTVLDWANDKNIGFSAFVSIGDGDDIDFGDLLDHLCSDSKTDAILIYMTQIKHARRFISAARAASRTRRILVLKGGRHQKDDLSMDIIYDSVISRSGMLRVKNMHELFAAVETLTHSVPLRGERLAILTNGGGPAIMASDVLYDRGGQLAHLDDDLIASLSQCLPASWTPTNPIDMIGDATTQRYIDCVKLLLDSDCADAILIMHSPSATSDSTTTAQALITAIQSHPRHKRFNILTNWSGEQSARQARQLFTQAGIPTYRTPESAVSAFMHLVDYRRNQKQLMETPTTAEPLHVSDVNTAREWVVSQLGSASAQYLDTHQCGSLLKQFQFQVLPTWIASDSSEAVHIAETIGYPVAVKLRSPDILHKSDVQGVVLNLRNSQEVASAAQAILDRVKLAYPSAHIHGLLVQGMAKVAGGEELRIKVFNDAIFGPVILLGQGGSEWNMATDASAALPPLNMTLARALIIRALKDGHIRPQKRPEPMDIGGLAKFLVRLSQMVVDVPQIRELDIHPVLANGDKFTILDADLTLCPYQGDGQERLAIRPFPAEFVETVVLKNGQTILLRPILPEDEPLHAEFIKHVSKDDLYKRFFSDVGEFNHEALANLTQIDYDREMAFVALTFTPQGAEIIGVSRALINPDNTDAEFAILIRSDLKGIGLGKILMNKIIDYCQRKGTQQISGMTMPTNRGMLMLAKGLGFTLDVQFEDGVADMVKRLI